MALQWKPQPQKVYQDWIDTIFDEAEDTLNDWEKTFLDDIQTWLNKSGRLTQNQAKKLEDIYTEKTKWMNH